MFYYELVYDFDDYSSSLKLFADVYNQGPTYEIFSIEDAKYVLLNADYSRNVN